MENYILKLNSGTEYKLYKGTTLVSDADLTTLFGTAGEMYLSFDFNSGTPSDLTTFTITDSSDNAVITNTDVTVAEGKNYKATWSASATTFDTFVELEGKALDESQLSFLMEKIKGAQDVKEYNLSTNTDISTIYDTLMGASVPGVVIVKAHNTSNSSVNIYAGANVSGRQVAVAPNEYAFLYLQYEPRGSSVNIDYWTALIFTRGFKYYMERRSSGSGSVYSLLTAGNVVDNLTSTSATNALSANQGRILNNNIGTLSSLTTTDKTSAVAAINEVNAKGAYSTTEQVVGTWIDGEPLYRKVLQISYTQSANTPYSSSVVVTPDSGVMGEIVGLSTRVDGNLSNPNQTVDFGNFYNTSSDYCRVFARADTLQIRSNSTETHTHEIIAVVEYTKTTG